MKKLYFTILAIIAALVNLPLIAWAVQISVPSAPGLGYFLVSTSTGAYQSTTTDPLHAGSFFGTSTATSTFNGGLVLTAGGLKIGTVTTCNTTSALTTDASGGVVCGAISGGSSFAYLFPSDATSTLLTFNGGLTSTGVTTLATTTASVLNGVIVVDGVRFARTNTGINQALAQCTTNGGGEVHLPSANYAISGAINVPSDCTLVGDGWTTILTYSTNAARISMLNVYRVAVRNLQIVQTSIVSGVVASTFGIYERDSNDVLIDHIRVTDAYGFGAFFDTTAITGSSTRITIQDSFLNGRGAADVIGGGPSDSISTITDIKVLNNTVNQDASQGTFYDGGITIVRANGYHFSGNTVFGFVVLGSEQSPHTKSIIDHNIVHLANGASPACTKLGFNVNTATSSGTQLILDGNIIDHGFLEVDSNLANGNVGIVGNGNTINASGCTYGVLISNVKGGIFTGFESFNGTDGVLVQNSSNVKVTGLIHNNTTGIVSSGTSNNNVYEGSVMYSNTSNYSTVGETNTYDEIKGGMTVTPLNNTIPALWVGTTTLQASIGAYSAPGDATLYVERSSGEGVGAVSAGTVARFQSNNGAGYNAYLGILSGTTGSAGINFGNKNNDALGTLKWLNGTSIFDFEGGNLGIGTTTPGSKLSVSGGVSIGINAGSAAPASGLYVLGKAGFGVTSPGSQLEVVGDGTGTFKVGVSGFGGNYVGVSIAGTLDSTNYNFLSSPNDTNLYINRPSTKAIRFRENNLDQVILDTGGNLGIGTTSPYAKLSVEGDAVFGGVNGVRAGVFTATSTTATSTFAGAVGIGTTTPAVALDVKGSIVTEESTSSFSATPTFDWSASNQLEMTLTSNVTSITFTKGYRGGAYRLLLCQDGTGSRTVAGWDAKILWSGGTVPTQTATANKCDIYTFTATFATTTGLKYLGGYVQNF